MNFQAIRGLLEFTREYPWAVPVLVVLGLAASLAEGVGIGLLIPLLDGVLYGAAERTSAASGPLAEMLQWFATVAAGERGMLFLGLIIVGLVALKTAILALDAVVSTGVIARAMRDLRVRLCDQLMRVGYEYFSRVPQGELVNLLDAQTYRASEALRALTVLIGSLCTMVVFGVMLLLLSWELTLVVALLVVPVSLTVRYLAGLAHGYGDRLVQSYTGLSGRILEILGAMRTIRVFNREKLETERFAAAAEEVRRSYMRTEIVNELLPPLVEFLYVPVFIAVLAIAWYMEVGVATVLVFLLLLYRLQNPLKRLNASRVTLAGYAAGIRDLQALLDTQGKPYTSSGDVIPGRLRGGIEFERVTFSYQGGGAAAVTDVTFTVRAGSVNAIVGDSGAGKSTVINLLCRLYDPASGTIRVDGVDLRDIDVHAWRSRVAFAGQDAELLSGSIRFNVAYGVDDVSDDRVQEVVRIAHADEFIDRLPDGLDTEVGARGGRLSGGQRQRIALARAILCRPDVLILDEATNAVDGVTEASIQAAIERLSRSTTIIIVAHRLGTLKRAENVIVMSGGRVVQQGAPEELLSAQGKLAALYAADRQLAD